MGMNQAAIVCQEIVTYQNTTAKALFTLPPGTTPLFAVVHTEVAFNDSGADTLEIGTSANASYFASGINVGAIGGQMVVLSKSPTLTAQTAIYAKYTGANGNSSAGRARISLVCTTPFDPS